MTGTGILKMNFRFKGHKCPAISLSSAKRSEGRSCAHAPRPVQCGVVVAPEQCVEHLRHFGHQEGAVVLVNEIQKLELRLRKMS